MTGRRFALLLHRQLGLSIGALLLLTALSGTLLVFRPELSRILYPHVFRSSDCRHRVSLAELTRRAAAAVPDSVLVYVEDMQSSCLNAVAIAVPRDTSMSSAPVMIGLDSATGSVAGQMPLAHNILNLALTLHTTFFTGPRGRWLVGTLGIALATMAVSGLVLWSNGQRQRLGPHLKRTYAIRKRYFAYDLHRAVGLTTSALLLVTAVTGVSMSYAPELQRALAYLSGGPEKPDARRIIVNAATTATTLDLARALDLASPLLSDAQPSIAGFSSDNPNVIYVQGRHAGDHYGYGREEVLLDARSARVLATLNTRSDPASWFILLEGAWTLHTGTALGLTGRALMLLIVGLGLCAQAMLGARLWWKRTRGRKGH